jgi:hypothetical protein
MSKMDELGKKLEKKVEEERQSKLNVLKGRLEYSEKVESLLKDMQGWLVPVLDAGSVSMGKEKLQDLMETEYEVPMLTARLKNGIAVQIRPVGWNIIGSKGRVDISVGEKNGVLVLKDHGWQILDVGGIKEELILLNCDSLADLIGKLVG